MENRTLKIINLKCEYRTNPLGIDIQDPCLSWQLESSRRGAAQTAYRLIAALGGDPLQQINHLHWDSGKVNSAQSTLVSYAGPLLKSRQRIYWRVQIWDEREEISEWSDPAWFEMGLLDKSVWQADWIGSPLVGGPRTSIPSPYFRRGFQVDRDILSARLYITSLGIYEASINGQRVGEDIFSPGWTDYSKRVQYQTYDVTRLLMKGENMLGVVLGDGWYCGHVAWEGRQVYGDRPKLLAQLEIILKNGDTQTICSNNAWETACGPLLEADMLMGEAYDARLELAEWDCPGDRLADSQNSGSWSPVLTFSFPENLALVSQNTSPVRVQEELPPIAEPVLEWGWPENNWILDFGQNLVGRIRLKIKGTRGRTIILRYGEVLDENGTLYTDNLRSARQTDYYTLKGDPDGEIYESRFTFHGFRYVQVKGLTEAPGRDLLTAIVLHSDHKPALDFECSNPLLNQLFHNIQWGWKGNSVDIPTDCPQRDERLGWTGDAQVFVKTATYLTDSASFFTKWIQDLKDAQLDYGAIPAVAPAPPSLKKSDGGAAWSDAFIIVPWTIWQQYGDTRVLENHYEAMCGYMEYLTANSPGLIRLLPSAKEWGNEKADEQIGGYGDWLAQDGNTDNRGLTPKDLIGTAFLAYDAKLMSQMAAAIGKSEDAKKFNQLYRDTRMAFINRFLTPDGFIIGQTQTAYVLALYFNLVPENLRPAVVAALIKDIEVNRKMHMSTGFVGTPYICQVLTDVGRVDMAYALLLQRTFPSWLYSVLNGATTIWERWDGWTEENGFHDPGMNSFNHYAYGAVGTWMVENILGIRPDPENPGFKHFLLLPQISDDLTFAKGKFQSPYGEILSHWRMNEGILLWDVIVPPNAMATAYIPSLERAQILEGGAALEKSNGLTILDITPSNIIVKLQPGHYQFQSKI